MKILTSLLLIIALLGTECPIYSQPSPPPKPQHTSFVDCWIGPIFGLIFLGVITYIGIKTLCKAAGLCEEHQNPPKPPEPPPTPPPWCTNAVPGHPDWPHTNCWPDNAGPPIFTLLPTMTVTATNMGFWSIAEAGFVAPNGHPYTLLQSFTISVSTNLTDWADGCSVTNWISTLGTNITGVMSEFYVSGCPFLTNWNAHPLIGDATTVELRIERASALPVQYFKIGP